MSFLRFRFFGKIVIDGELRANVGLVKNEVSDLNWILCINYCLKMFIV